jgi:hypothetical protein
MEAYGTLNVAIAFSMSWLSLAFHEEVYRVCCWVDQL